MVQYGAASFSGTEVGGVIAATVVISNNVPSAVDVTVTCSTALLLANPATFPNADLATGGKIR